MERLNVRTWLGVCAACVLSLVPSAPRSVQWPPDTRVLISDFSYVEAVAASPWLVFAATRHGLVIYDRAARRWRAPVTPLDGYPGTRVRTALADPGGNAVWLGLLGGGWTRYDVDARTWLPGTPPPGAGAGALTVEGALARAPAAAALRALILTDPRLRQHQFTAAAGTADRPELFFGTNGMGLVRVDPLTAEWEALPFGLVAPGVGAVAYAAGGVWAAASARPGERRGLTWLADDLAETRATEWVAPIAARRLLATRDALWLASERGVSRIDPGSLRAREFEIPGVTAIAPAPDGVWVGTLRGLAVITRENEVVRVSSDYRVLSLVAARESLWVGTDAGLVVLAPGRSDGTLVPGYRVPVRALAHVRDTVVAATDRSLVWRDATGRWAELPLPLSLGRPNALAPDAERGVWIGGTQGLAHADVGRGFMRALTVPFDVPAAVRDLTAHGDYLWVATDSGVVRYDRQAVLHR